MTVYEARQNADQVLDVERKQPTVTYLAHAPFVNEEAFRASALGQRGWHPRPVSESPGKFQLFSRNYELLKSFFEEILPEERPLFLANLRDRIRQPNAFDVIGGDLLGSGKTDRTNSELPLVAEFIAREGDPSDLLRALRDAALRPGLTDCYCTSKK